MDQETIAATAFMIFGLGFFLYVIHLGQRDNDLAYHRSLMEAREFGKFKKQQRRRFRRQRTKTKN